ncbi:MAG: glycoside hydrolase family 36 protein, partial [Bacillus sp. (in: firmicutes)]
RKRCRLVEVQVTGENQDDHHGSKHTRTNPGFLLEYKEYRDFRNDDGRKLEIELEKDGLIVISHIQFYDNVSVVRFWTELRNESESTKGIEYVSSFALTGIEKERLQCWSETSRLHVPHNTWYGEMQWRTYSLPELGLSPVNYVTLKRIGYNSQGTWSSSELLPMGCFENLESRSALMWQIEHNGSWHWELGEQAEHLYIQLSGPSENESHWWKELKSGESFTSVTAAVGVSCDFEKAVVELTKYRRLIRRENDDNKKLPVIFNDYANCLDGDPTTEKLIPLIDAAAEVGCEIFCIDAGWYSDGDWWDGVGEWLPSNVRFPGGIEEPLNYIRSKGMIPGLWLEIEVIGIHCPLAEKCPDDWFFVRHGKRIVDHGRYQLNFRNPEVVRYADQVVDRLVNEYGIG